MIDLDGFILRGGFIKVVLWVWFNFLERYLVVFLLLVLEFDFKIEK